MQDFEKLGQFYLGRQYDLANRAPQDELVLYDAKDLTTHAVCVGMTGSGKTGLCLALLEEAAIDGIPAIAIDPKGDLANLLLTFPELRGADFRPWIDESEASREGVTPDVLADQTAERWRKGLAEWGQDGARIKKYRDAVDIAIYTPGSSAGLPLAVLRSFAAPPQAIRDDSDALAERISAAVSGLLALVGVEADPIRSREHILLANILEKSWREGRDLDVGGLIRGIQKPPFDKVGVVDLESFFPAKDRTALAMQLNNLIASPGFAGWIEGEPLEIGRLLYTPEGKPRLAILSIAHLSEAERMFFVTILLNEIVSWVRTQPGTSSLRAILYMDEIFGYFPPTANPPSKGPMLTLLKQARAYGLGIVLATQNPVDLDYKGLSNTGTWFLGRLQTERDKARVLEGLEGASAAAGSKFDKAEMAATLAGLGKRIFLMNNVHDNQPVVFESRWCLSFLRGPLTRAQIQSLMAPYKQGRPGSGATSTASPAAAEATVQAAAAGTPSAGKLPEGSPGEHPIVPPESGECFMPLRDPVTGKPVTYRPTLVGSARLHFVDAKVGIDAWQNVTLIAPVGETMDDDVWSTAQPLAETHREFDEQPAAGAKFNPLPSPMLRGKNYASWQKALASHLYQRETLKLWRAPAYKETSRADEAEGDFRVRIQQRAREERDAAVADLRAKYAARFEALEEQRRRASARVEREQEQFKNQALDTVVSIGTSILGALLGRKRISQTTVRGAATAAGRAGRANKKRGDVGRAEDNVEAIDRKIQDLDAELANEVRQLESAPNQVEIVEYPVRPRKTDIAVERVALAWVPMA
jgi:hypothetical protein